MSGALSGALLGGVIGDSIDHHGWEGAGIGAAAGLVLGGIAELTTRANERSYYRAPTPYTTSQSSVSDPPAATSTPAAPATAPEPTATQTRVVAYQSSSTVGDANHLFGR